MEGAMNGLMFASLLALVPLQSPATVVSEDQSLRGVSALSVSVRVEGKLIDAVRTKADIETKLKQRGVRVLNQGLPRLYLQVDNATTNDGRDFYELFTIRLELAQALVRPGGGDLVEGVTWSSGAFGIFDDNVTKRLDARVSGMVAEFLGALLSVNAGLAKTAGAAGLGLKQTIHTMDNRAYLESFYDLPRGKEDIVVAQLQRLIDQRQQLLVCTYGPSNKAAGTGFVTYAFWYKSPPAGLGEILAVAPPGTHPFRSLGKEGLGSCPETPEIASRLTQR
jgi:hypothetical protein